VLLTSLPSFQRGLTPPQYPFTHFPQPDGNSDCLLHSLKLVCQKASYNVLLLPRRSPHLLLRPLIAFPAVLPGPLQIRPLCSAGTAQQVIHSQVAANFWDPPSPWVHFFSFYGALWLNAGPRIGPPVLP
jgi:hypothetical protein